MKYIIVEDEPLAAKRLHRMVSKCAPEFRFAGTFGGVMDALPFLAHVKLDLIFMDLELGDGDALELIQKAKPNCHIIFISAYCELYNFLQLPQALTFLPKPITESALKMAFNKFNILSASSTCIVSNNSPSDPTFLIRLGLLFEEVALKDIVCLYKKNQHPEVLLNDGRTLPFNLEGGNLETYFNADRYDRMSDTLFLQKNAAAMALASVLAKPSSPLTD
jgi:DNA-binding LytR/AlgR family response regulator